MKVGDKYLRLVFTSYPIYGAGLGHPDAAWGVPETSSSLCRESPPIFAAGVLQRLRQTLFDLCRRPLSMSAANLGRPLRQTSEHICRKGRSTPAASLGVGLLVPRFYPRFSMNSIARAISSGVSMPMVS